MLSIFLASLMFGWVFVIAGCGLGSGTPAGAVVGRKDAYDYSPSVIQIGNNVQFWWCGQAHNPNDSSQNTDTILYESINQSTGSVYGPIVVLGETPGAWDSAYTCNPKVVKGHFVNPLRDGQTYSYAMYYVGTASLDGVNNSIGVAFCNDGIHWRKNPEPVIVSISQAGYGPAQPAVFNSDHNASVWLFYEDSSAPANHHEEAVSTDGVHFVTRGVLTTNGLDPGNPGASWGDMAYDPITRYWYAAFNLPSRLQSTTGDLLEHGSYGLQLYRIPEDSLLTGATPWEQLKTIDTNLTGYELNFLAGFLRDPYGDVNVGSYPTIQLFTSVSNPPPSWDAPSSWAGSSGRMAKWDISSATWVPHSPLLAFNRYRNKSTHEVTTGWIDPQGGFLIESTLGHLYEAPQEGATVAFYGCKSGTKDYFVSLDSTCEGQRILGVNGYGYSQSTPSLNQVAIYRCHMGPGHFVSKDPKCEGSEPQGLLGYILP
jgi:hypothetical protein